MGRINKPSGVRYAEIEHENSHGRVRVVLDIDGEQKSTADTGIGYFDHVLGLLAYCGRFDLGVSAEGDLLVDDRHTVENVGVCFGRAWQNALAGTEQITRFGSEIVPLDDVLVLVSIDISGRPFLAFDVNFNKERIGGLSTDSIELFLRSFTQHAGLTLHVKLLAGKNNHLICEAVFKGLGIALRKAVVPFAS
ncbi:MAG: imidazoleglycerol-phosphate dehydratase [Fimbriimonadales bacterium]